MLSMASSSSSSSKHRSFAVSILHDWHVLVRCIQNQSATAAGQVLVLMVPAAVQVVLVIWS